MPELRELLRARLAELKLGPARETEIVEELAAHLEDRVKELQSGGLAEGAAQQAALAEVDAESLARELLLVERPAPSDIALGSDNRGSPFDRIRQNVRFAARTLRRRPGFTAVAVLTLALGIGANTAIFSAVRGVLLQPLPYRDPGRLVTFWLTARDKGLPVVNLPDPVFLYYREHARTFESVAAYNSGSMILGIGDQVERVPGAAVSHEFFDVLGVTPMLGRGFRPGEDVRGAPLVSVISYGLWQRQFGGDSAIIGRSMLAADQPVTIVGVMPPGFDFPDGAQAWGPTVLDPERFSSWYLNAIGRLRAGADTADARAEIASLYEQVRDQHTDRFSAADRANKPTAEAHYLLDNMVGTVRSPLLILLGAVSLVLLIACANVATLLLTRATARAHEMALRCCLGARPARVAEQLLTESLLLAALGGGVGILLAGWMVAVLRRLAPAQFPRLELVRLDVPVMLFALGVALLTGLLFGLVPALQGARVNLTDVLKESAKGGGTSHRRWNDIFVAGQIAVSLVLLIGAGLLLRSFQRLSAVDPGFDPQHVLVARISLPYPRYDTVTAVRRFFARLDGELAAIPGVTAVGVTNRVPFSRGNPQNELIVEGGPDETQAQPPVVNVRTVSPNYFAAIGTPIISGRVFSAADDSAALPVVIVDSGLARRYWPGQDPIGKRLRIERGPNATWLTVIGVAATIKHSSLDERATLQLYLPFGQSGTWNAYLTVRSGTDPVALAASVRRVVSQVDSKVPVFEIGSMEGLLDRSLGTRRLTDVLLAAFACTALLLAAIGIYGVMSLNVTARLREFGIRLALGAEPGAVRDLVIRRGMRLALVGVGAGLVAAIGLTRLLEGLLYEVEALDPFTFAVVSVVLASVALLACGIPALRATRADPMTALRQE